jgi:hypothetical protein
MLDSGYSYGPGELFQITGAVIAGAALSLIAPVAEFMGAITIIIVGDLYMAWRIGHRDKTGSRTDELRDAVGRAADYLATMIVAHVFEERFLQGIPITFIMGAAIAMLEMRSMNAKLVRLRNIDLFKMIGDKLQGRGSK